jgi:alanine racemase
MDAKQTLAEPRCLISRAALLHNISLIRKRLAPSVKICAVVKADAYGHDSKIVTDTLCNFSTDNTEPPVVDALAVADMDEAAVISNCNLPLLVLRPVENSFLGGQRAKLEHACQNGWILTLTSASAADDLARIAQARRRRAAVQIMVNTGLNRAGVDPDKFNHLVDHIAVLPALKLVGIATHFACADEPDHAFNSHQLTRFLDSTKIICGINRAIRPHRSAANSAGIFFHPDSHLDIVRPGISMYGIDPTGQPNMDRPLRPALRWVAPLIDIRDIPAGQCVGYGQTWKAERPTRLGLLPIGYADGYPRALSNRGVMMVHGKPAPVVGRVSMDLTIIDLHDIPHPVVGDEVIVLDNDPLSPASVYKLAELAGTIPYEILSRIGPRVRRVPMQDFGIPDAESNSEPAELQDEQ